MGQAIADGVDTFFRGGEVRASGIPAEEIVVTGELAARRFHEGEAGQQTPIQLIAVGDFQEGRGVLFGGAVGQAEEGAKGF